MRAKLNVSSASISYVCINNIIKIKPTTYLPLFKPAKKKVLIYCWFCQSKQSQDIQVQTGFVMTEEKISTSTF